jgi:peptidoglycan hydrolase-like protein with peptidoglycan-binding domain
MSHSENASASPPYPGDVLERGDRGAEVRTVQERLNDVLGGPDLEVDGRYGSATELAVERFQRAEGLSVDGEVGPRTWAALFDDATTPAAIAKAVGAAELALAGLNPFISIESMQNRGGGGVHAAAATATPWSSLAARKPG